MFAVATRWEDDPATRLSPQTRSIASGVLRCTPVLSGVIGEWPRPDPWDVCMKATLYDGSRKTVIDTGQDICLTSGSHASPKSSDARIYRKDLYMHRTHANPVQYYFHIRPSGKAVKDKVIPVSPIMAERYLMRRGITCSQFPANDAVSRLYAWGYGIAEEF